MCVLVRGRQAHAEAFASVAAAFHRRLALPAAQPGREAQQCIRAGYRSGLLRCYRRRDGDCRANASGTHRRRRLRRLETRKIRR